MKRVKLCMALLLILSCIGCSTKGNDQIEFLIKGTMKGEDYILEKEELYAKVVFYAQHADFEELSLMIENENDQTLVLKKTLPKEKVLDEAICEVKIENMDGRSYLSVGINGEYEKTDIGEKWHNIFAESYHVSKEENANLDLMQFLEYSGCVAETVDLFSIKKLPLDKGFIVKLAVS